MSIIIDPTKSSPIISPSYNRNVSSVYKGLLLDLPLTDEWLQSSTTASDLTPYRNHLTSVGSVTFDSDGATFNGSSYIFRYVDNDWRGDDFIGTVTAWIKTTDFEGLILGSLVYGSSSGWQFFVSGGHLRYTVTGLITFYGTGVVSDGEWHHVCIRHDGSKLTTFIDGEIDLPSYTPAYWIGSSTTSRNTIALGARPGITGIPLVGNIKYVKMWNRTLSDDEIRFFYNQKK